MSKYWTPGENTADVLTLGDDGASGDLEVGQKDVVDAGSLGADVVLQRHTHMAI